MDYTIINDNTASGLDVWTEHITARNDEDARYQMEQYIRCLSSRKGQIITLLKGYKEYGDDYMKEELIDEIEL